MKYSIKALAVYLVAMVVTFLLNEYSSFEFNAAHISFCGLFMYGSSLLVHYATKKASEESATRFPAHFMAITGLKMAAYIIVLGAYVFVYRREAIPVIIAFLIFYLVFTILEVISAMKIVKSKS